MARPSIFDWEKWHIERQSFAKRDTTGFKTDLQALHAHILKLQELAPKDAAGWPHTTALRYLTQLQAQYDKAKRYLETFTIPKETH